MAGSITVRATVAVLSVAFLAPACSGGRDAAVEASQVEAIEAGMRARFDRPDARISVGPVAVSGGHAVADWSQGGEGGRALLARSDGEWRIVLCSGAALKSADYLRQARVPQGDAVVIARRLAEAENGLDPDRLARIDSFDGTMMVADMPAADPHAAHVMDHSQHHMKHRGDER